MRALLWILMLWSCSSASMAEIPFYNGFWEYDIEVKMTAMPQAELKKVQICIRELNDVINVFKPEPSCSINSVEVGSGHVSWNLYCKSINGTHHGHAEISGDSRSLQGRVEMQTSIPGVNSMVNTTYIIRGVNQGVCQ